MAVVADVGNPLARPFHVGFISKLFGEKVGPRKKKYSDCFGFFFVFLSPKGGGADKA